MWVGPLRYAIAIGLMVSLGKWRARGIVVGVEALRDGLVFVLMLSGILSSSVSQDSLDGEGGGLLAVARICAG